MFMDDLQGDENNGPSYEDDGILVVMIRMSMIRRKSWHH